MDPNMEMDNNIMEPEKQRSSLLLCSPCSPFPAKAWPCCTCRWALESKPAQCQEKAAVSLQPIDVCRISIDVYNHLQSRNFDIVNGVMEGQGALFPLEKLMQPMFVLCTGCIRCMGCMQLKSIWFCLIMSCFVS